LTSTGLTRFVAAGAIIVRIMMETLGQHSVLVSDSGLREGVLIDLASMMRGESAWAAYLVVKNPSA